MKIIRNCEFVKKLGIINLRRGISAIIAIGIGTYLLYQGLNLLEIFIAELVPAFLVFLNWYYEDCRKYKN